VESIPGLLKSLKIRAGSYGMSSSRSESVLPCPVQEFPAESDITTAAGEKISRFGKNLKTTCGIGNFVLVTFLTLSVCKLYKLMHSESWLQVFKHSC
jgi:hypothetical protein